MGVGGLWLAQIGLYPVGTGSNPGTPTRYLKEKHNAYSKQ